MLTLRRHVGTSSERPAAGEAQVRVDPCRVVSWRRGSSLVSRPYSHAIGEDVSASRCRAACSSHKPIVVIVLAQWHVFPCLSNLDFPSLPPFVSTRKVRRLGRCPLFVPPPRGQVFVWLASFRSPLIPNRPDPNLCQTNRRPRRERLCVCVECREERFPLTQSRPPPLILPSSSQLPLSTTHPLIRHPRKQQLAHRFFNYLSYPSPS
ncbi:hypothetical protein GGS23DRAFT_288453 [Durotheca rogersii]|uniref:uncharacterized protein n=1 Tax=Durotheca rogersii TaxID=419775 RepID=UPI0022203643|nr:uncharacterized protein GGS23DRAFT_288453 [Durotheca rogersii]KAI5866774.1 hypothetical protein GGS23DRAFT_288453 [Durotheca rogersii]